MKVLHLCKMDGGGGAADGFMRIHRALLGQGIHSVAYVMKARSGAPGIISASALAGLGGRFGWHARRLAAKAGRLGRTIEGVFDFDAEGCFPFEVILGHAKGIHDQWDLVILHWPGGYLSPESAVAIAEGLGARLALWQVDMAHMTGGCHYSLDCDGYIRGCGACPMLASTDPEDISRQQAESRRWTWGRSRPLVLCQSSWSAAKARRSRILGGLETAVLPIPIESSGRPGAGGHHLDCRALGIPGDGRRTALVRAVDTSVRYKGFAHFQAALRSLDAAGIALHVLCVGERGLIPAGLRHITHTDLGHLADGGAMHAAYQSADFFVCTSIDDAGPMMVSEALVAGRPVLTTPVGIGPDLIRDGANGFVLPSAGDPEIMAAGLRYYCELSPDSLLAQKSAAASTAPLLSAARFVESLSRAARNHQ